MNKLVMGAAILVAAATGASAADLSPAYKAPPPYVPAWTWTGFYGGVNLGGAWARETETGTVTGLGSISVSSSFSSVIGGGQFGYNWQASNFVLGLEADVDGSGESNTFSCVAFIVGCGASVTDKVNVFGTVRGRLGVAFDRWLVYGTGGFSWQNVSRTATATVPGIFSATATTSATRGGYAVGAGIETALWGNWIGGVEYLYLDTGTWTPNTFTVGGITASESLRLQNNVVRGRLSYKF